MVDDTKIVSVKSTLCTPYTVEWPLLEKGETPEIIHAIQRTFEPLKGKLGKVKSRGRKSNKHKTKMLDDDSHALRQVKAKQDRGLIRSQILIGINEVTRGLERGLLRSVVVCRSTKPSHMTNHLFALSATRETPALCLFKLSEILAPLLNLNTVMAIGFKKTNGENSVFDDLVDLIIKKTPSLSLPWLQENKINLENLRRDHPRVQLRTTRITDEESTSNNKKILDEGKSGLSTRPVAQNTLPKIGECEEEGNSKNKLQGDPEKLLGKKRQIEESCSELAKKQKLCVSTTEAGYIEAGYIDVRIDKVKVIPKESKPKKRKKKKGQKSKVI